MHYENLSVIIIFDRYIQCKRTEIPQQNDVWRIIFVLFEMFDNFLAVSFLFAVYLIDFHEMAD